jgi:hypothetical protein
MSNTNKKYLFYAMLFFLIGFGCKSALQNTNAVEKNSNTLYVLSSRFFHPRSSNDIHSTVKAIEQLKPKRIDWTYYESDEILSIYKKYQLPFSLAINPQIRDSSGYTSKKLRMKDFEGNTYVAPWMKNWKVTNPYWGCVNNPYFYDLFVKKTLFLASKGAYGIFVDDALFNVRLTIEKKVGCFCEHCVALFNAKNEVNTTVNSEIVNKIVEYKANKTKIRDKELSALIKKYEAFQFNSVVLFFNNWKKIIKEQYPDIVFLTNNYNGNWNEIYRVFDIGIAEVKENFINDAALDSLYTVADHLQKKQLFTIATENKQLQYKLLEYNKQHNKESIYPWDIFIPEKNERFYIDLDTITLKIKELKKITHKS